jgi:nucleotide sugar dehydrogenase
MDTFKTGVKIGICGVGFVGNAIYQFFKSKYSTVTYDKYKNINNFDILLSTNLLFICLPTNINTDINKSSYDMSSIDETLLLLNTHNYTGLIIIKSTILPTYCSEMNTLLPNLKIINNPEFLSAKTSVEDFAKQSHIVIGHTKYSKDTESLNLLLNIYKESFPNINISITSSEESSLVKLGCNSFYAMKIEFFTELYLLCDKLQINYDNVKNIMLKNNWINPMHTLVPGPDSKISYGGLCLPKDIIALSNLMKMYKTPNLVVNAVIKENKKTRKIKIQEK